MVTIKPFIPAEHDFLLEHFARHFAESGREGDINFMPFEPNDKDRPKGIAIDKATLPLDQPGWQRWFCAWDDDSGNIVGHINLKQDGLKTSLHRCELGIGIERGWRGQGLGERLMQTAIRFAQEAESLIWLDLKHFAHNTRARALYDKLGFTELGVLRDRFRIGNDSIDDILMTLRVG